MKNQNQMGWVNWVVLIGSVLMATTGVAKNLLNEGTNNRALPIEIEADSASYQEKIQTYTLKGDVILKQGTLMMSGQEAIVRVDAQGYQYATLSGQAKIRQARQSKGDVIEAMGQKIEYDTKSEKAAISGGARLARLEANQVVDQIEGDKILYFKRLESYHVEKGGTRQRVRAVIRPGKIGF